MNTKKTHIILLTALTLIITGTASAQYALTDDAVGAWHMDEISSPSQNFAPNGSAMHWYGSVSSVPRGDNYALNIETIDAYLQSNSTDYYTQDNAEVTWCAKFYVPPSGTADENSTMSLAMQNRSSGSTLQKLVLEDIDSDGNLNDVRFGIGEKRANAPVNYDSYNSLCVRGDSAYGQFDEIKAEGFLNGESIFNDTGETFEYMNSGNFVVNGFPDGLGGFDGTGRVDEVLYTKRWLSNTEMQEYHNAGFTTSTTTADASVDYLTTEPATWELYEPVNVSVGFNESEIDVTNSWVTVKEDGTEIANKTLTDIGGGEYELNDVFTPTINGAEYNLELYGKEEDGDIVTAQQTQTVVNKDASIDYLTTEPPTWQLNEPVNVSVGFNESEIDVTNAWVDVLEDGTEIANKTLTDIGGGEYELDNVFTPTTDGAEYNLAVYGKEADGDLTTGQEIQTVEADTNTTPVIQEINTEPTPMTLEKPVTVNSTVTDQEDNIENVWVNVYFDNELIANETMFQVGVNEYEASNVFTPTQAGENYNIEVVAKDNTSLTDSDSITVSSNTVKSSGYLLTEYAKAGIHFEEDNGNYTNSIQSNNNMIAYGNTGTTTGFTGQGFEVLDTTGYAESIGDAGYEYTGGTTEDESKLSVCYQTYVPPSGQASNNQGNFVGLTADTLDPMYGGKLYNADNDGNMNDFKYMLGQSNESFTDLSVEYDSYNSICTRQSQNESVDSSYFYSELVLNGNIVATRNPESDNSIRNDNLFSNDNLRNGVNLIVNDESRSTYNYYNDFYLGDTGSVDEIVYTHTLMSDEELQAYDESGFTTTATGNYPVVNSISTEPSNLELDTSTNITADVTDADNNIETVNVKVYENDILIADTQMFKESGDVYGADNVFTPSNQGAEYTINVTATDSTGYSDTVTTSQIVGEVAVFKDVKTEPETWEYEDTVNVTVDLFDTINTYDRVEYTVKEDDVVIADSTFTKLNDTRYIRDNMFTTSNFNRNYRLNVTAVQTDGTRNTTIISQYIQAPYSGSIARNYNNSIVSDGESLAGFYKLYLEKYRQDIEEYKLNVTSTFEDNGTPITSYKEKSYDVSVLNEGQTVEDTLTYTRSGYSDEFKDAILNNQSYTVSYALYPSNGTHRLDDNVYSNEVTLVWQSSETDDLFYNALQGFYDATIAPVVDLFESLVNAVLDAILWIVEGILSIIIALGELVLWLITFLLQIVLDLVMYLVTAVINSLQFLIFFITDIDYEYNNVTYDNVSDADMTVLDAINGNFSMKENGTQLDNFDSGFTLEENSLLTYTNNITIYNYTTGDASRFYENVSTTEGGDTSNVTEQDVSTNIVLNMDYPKAFEEKGVPFGTVTIANAVLGFILTMIAFIPNPILEAVNTLFTVAFALVNLAITVLQTVGNSINWVLTEGKQLAKWVVIGYVAVKGMKYLKMYEDPKVDSITIANEFVEDLEETADRIVTITTESFNIVHKMWQTFIETLKTIRTYIPFV